VIASTAPRGHSIAFESCRLCPGMVSVSRSLNTKLQSKFLRLVPCNGQPFHNPVREGLPTIQARRLGSPLFQQIIGDQVDVGRLLTHRPQHPHNLPAMLRGVIH
jgi:hypothetical protein